MEESSILISQKNYTLSVMRATYDFFKNLYAKKINLDIAEYLNGSISSNISLNEMEYSIDIIKKSPNIQSILEYYLKTYKESRENLYSKVHSFILENIKLEFDSQFIKSNISDNLKVLSIDDPELKSYVLLGIYSFYGNLLNDPLIQSDQTIVVDNQEVNLLEELKKLSKEEFLKYYNDLNFKYLPLIDLKDSLLSVIKDHSIDYIVVAFKNLEDKESSKKTFLVGVDKYIFESELKEYLHSNKLLGISSKTNEAWE